MIRERITILNPGSSHEGFIEEVDGTHLKLSETGMVERKITGEYKLPDSIKQVRIQMKRQEVDSRVFQYEFGSGLHISVVPNTRDEEVFYQEMNDFLDLIGLQGSDEWIMSYNSLYYHTPEVRDWTLEGYGIGRESALDINWSNGQVVIKTLNDQAVKEYQQETGVKKEIGVFLIDDEISTKDDLVLSGVRIELMGQEDYIHRTLFHIKPRIRKIGESEVKLVSNGMHPKLQTNYEHKQDLDQDVDLESCQKYQYMTIPKEFFLDKYQIGNNQLVVNFGNLDLEKPSYLIKEWGTELLLQVPNQLANEIEIHSRYQTPNNLGKTTISFNKPINFIACDLAKDEEYLLQNNPFDNKLSIGANFDKLFTNKTVFYLFDQPHDQLQVDIPNARPTNVDLITLSVLFVGVVIILRRLLLKNKLKLE